MDNSDKSIIFTHYNYSHMWSNHISTILNNLVNKELTVDQAYILQRDLVINILEERIVENNKKYESFNGKMNGWGVAARTDQELIDILKDEPEEFNYFFSCIKLNLIILNDKAISIGETYHCIISAYIDLLDILININDEIYKEFAIRTNNVMHNSPIKIIELKKIIELFNALRL